jgi:hypothetical protein
MMIDPKARKRLRLILDVPGIWADDLDELAAVWADGEEVTDADRLLVATEEWFRREAIIVLTTIPGEKCLADDFEVLPRPCRIVGVQAVAGEPDEGERT